VGQSNLPAEQFPGEGRWSFFEFAGNDTIDSVTYNHLRSEVRAFLSSRDTTKGIHIRLSRRTTYGTFVRILDMLNEHLITRYSVEGPDLWLPKFLPVRRQLASDDTVFICAGVVDVGSPFSWRHKWFLASRQFAFLQERPALQVFAVSVVAVLLMCGFDIYRINRQNQSRLNIRRLTSGST
jgi:hypothetical protein